MKLYLTVLFTFAAACGDDPTPRDTTPDTSAEVEPDSAAEVEPDSAEVELDVAVDTNAEVDDTLADSASDVAMDVETEVTPELVQCDDFEACNALLTDAGLCPGACFATDDTLRCDATVKHAVCHTYEPVDTLTEAVDYGDFTVTPIAWPADTTVGETSNFEVHITNDTAAELVVPFRWKNPQTFLFEAPSWDGVTSFTLPPNGTVVLSARVTAQSATTLSAGGNLIVTFAFRDEDPAFEPRATVHFADTEAVVCGGEHFPEAYCPDPSNCYASYSYYVSAQCCDEVFFPGATCCDDTDCAGDPAGACVDGKCAYGAPWLGSANNVAVGHQTIRLVLVDSHMQFAGDPCANHYEDVKNEIDFAGVEAWYDDLAQRRLGRNAVDFQWVVTGGVATTDFLTGPNYWDNFSNELNAWLEARGCPILDTADKLIISAGTIDLMGFGGFYTDSGHIAVFAPYNTHLLTHELAHSFGATDLYLDLGGALLYPKDLMGNNLSAPPLPGDKVAWGELGFGDVDRNGVVDVVEFAAFPETLEVANATATITTKNTLEIRWEFVGLDGGVRKRVVIPSYTIEVPLVGAALFNSYSSARWKVVTFDHTQLDLDALEAAGELAVRIETTYRFTDRDWTYRALPMNDTLVLPVTRQ